MADLRSINRTALLSAGLVFGLGVFLTWQAAAYPLGTANQMGAGFYPMLIGSAMLIVGVLILIFEAILPLFVSPRTAQSTVDPQSAHDDETPFNSINWRPLVIISVALLVFAFLMQFTGLVWSVVALVLIGGMAEPKPKWITLIPLSIGTALGAWLIFIVGLGLPLRAL